MEDSSVTSSGRTVRREENEGSEGREERIDALTEDGDVRAVAMTGSVVVRRRCTVRARPIPRDEGLVRRYGIAGGREEMRARERERDDSF